MGQGLKGRCKVYRSPWVQFDDLLIIDYWSLFSYLKKLKVNEIGNYKAERQLRQRKTERQKKQKDRKTINNKTERQKDIRTERKKENGLENYKPELSFNN